MKMPDQIAEAMFAPCGMNCAVCQKRCYNNNPCVGCSSKTGFKAEKCRKCAIKDCIAQKKIHYCFECFEFPCEKIKAHSERNCRNSPSTLIENSEKAKEKGVRQFLDEQRKEFFCTECGGIVSFQDGRCSDCHKKFF
jgi:hypothetical protein